MDNSGNRRKLAALAVASAFLLGGCATNGDKRDPLEPLNRGIYQLNDTVDKAVIKPVAQGYKAVLPQPVRTGVGNFFSNLDDAVVVANDLLQFKLERSVNDFLRLLTNTTIGLAGLLDVATPMGLEKHNEDFGQTLGYWGIPDGPYLVLPILGPSSFRDTLGRVADWQVDPLTQHPEVAERNWGVAVKLEDVRARLLDTDQVLDDAAIDPYVFVRDAYLQRRRNLVYDGEPPRRKFDDDE
ncbi:MAG: VacJ family lipoprotein [Sulfuricella sp.]|nr:VacJ family lipoprotein [Sulfuricella sp.]